MPGTSLVLALVGAMIIWTMWRAGTHTVVLDVHTPPAPHLALSGLTADDLRVNINTADVGEVQLLPGVGRVLARRIVEHRRSNGPFESLADLAEVHGVGPMTLERLAPVIFIEQLPNATRTARR